MIAVGTGNPEPVSPGPEPREPPGPRSPKEDRAQDSAHLYAEAEERYRALVEGSIQGICIQRGYVILFANTALARMLGYDSPQELVGRDLRTLVVPVERQRLEAIQAARDRGEPAPTRYEVEGVRKDGSRVQVEVLASPVLWQSEPATMGTIVDVTERLRAEEALRESQRTLRAVIDAVPAMISAKDRELRYVFMNRLQAQAHGVSADEAVGRTASELLGRERAGPAEAIDREVIATGQPRQSYEEQHRDAQGGLTSWLTTKVPLRDGAGRIVSVVTIAVDITERKRLEEELRQAQKMEGVGRLAGSVAHDFNNLLMVITGRTQLLLARAAAGDLFHRELAVIHQAAERGASLTRQLLAFSRRQVLQPKILDIHGVLADLEPILRRLLGETIDLVIRPAAARATIEADRGQLEQVVLNLVVNARDAMPRGGQLTLETASLHVDEDAAGIARGSGPGDYVLLAVRDTGHGMTAETRTHIFEPFFTTKAPGKGTGLGLATVYGIVKQSGGFVTVESEVDRGTVFRIYLPVAEPTSAATADEPMAAATRGSETVLLVEDDPDVREVVRDVLAEAGYTVLEVSGPDEAVGLSTRFPGALHLLLTDVVMAGMSGGELAERIMTMRPGIKVLYMSGYTDDDIVRHGVQARGIPLLHKPFSTGVLARAVRQVLDASNPALG
ncbi:MAG: PAS domain S-box protein [Candidatus Rokuibacteriota bacterium]